MADLGDLLGSLMSGLIRARRVADEQTAALAEYYKTQPLLEGLSVPRIRIPELTIDMPFIIEGSSEGDMGSMANPADIASEVQSQLKSTIAGRDIKTSQEFNKEFLSQVKNNLESLKKSGNPIMKETIARSVHDAFINAATKTKTNFSEADKIEITKELRSKVSNVGFIKEPRTPGIIANIKTADVKEKASDSNVVRLKITMKEEGLEWAVQTNDNGGIVKTLQPE